MRLIWILILNVYLSINFVNSDKIMNFKNSNFNRKPIRKNPSKSKSLGVRSDLDINTLHHIEPTTTMTIDYLDNKLKHTLSMTTNTNIEKIDFTSNFKEFVENYTLLLEKNTYNILSNIPWTPLYEFKACINKNCQLEKTIYSYELCLHQCQEKVVGIIEPTVDIIS